MNQAEADWHQIVNDIGPCLYRYFCATFPSALASDLVQESLIRLVQKHRAGDFIPTKGTLKSYAFGIARYVRLEAQKSRPGFEPLDDDSEPGVPPAQDDGDDVAHLRWAIGKLKPIEQEIILLMIDSDSSLTEIAAALDLPMGTVKSHIHRAKESLRHIMEVKK